MPLESDLEPGFLGGPLRNDDTLPMRAYRRIRQAMVDGELPPGLQISEPRLSQELGISRAALREALVRLETQGFVSRNKSGRWQVSQMSRQDAEEMYVCRAALEGLAARLAAANRTDRDVREMTDALGAARSRYEAGDIRGAAEATTRFHDTVLTASGNNKLMTLMNMLRPQLLHNRMLMLEHGTRRRTFVHQNEGVLKAITERDGSEAEALAKASAAEDLEAVLGLFDAEVLGASRPATLLGSSD